MNNLLSYYAGCDRGGCWGHRLLVFCRRVLRRLLRPMFYLRARLLRDIYERLERLERQQQAARAFDWDHVAMTRRLAVLEDHLLTQSPPPVAAADGAHSPVLRAYPNGICRGEGADGARREKQAG